MGLFKGMMFLSGLPVRPTTTRERGRSYQRQTNRLLEDIADSVANQNHVGAETSYDSEPTRKCPDCAERILIEARKCRFCGIRFSDEDIAEQMKAYEVNRNSAIAARANQSPTSTGDFLVKAQKLGDRFTKFVNELNEKHSSNKSEISEAAEVSSETHIDCPSCKQMIMRSAVICRHCQKSV